MPDPSLPAAAAEVADTYQFGRFADGSGRKLWLTTTISIFDGDARTATPEQAAAIATARAALEPSLRVWYGLDPRAASETNRGRVIAAVWSAIHRAASLRNWSATVDEAGLVKRPGPRKTHSVYAVRERRWPDRGQLRRRQAARRPPAQARAELAVRRAAALLGLRERIGITAPAPRRLLTPGRSC